MPCHTMKISGGGYAIVCTRGRKAKPCAFCGKPSDKLCDWPVGNGKTCDAEMCNDCARTLGRQHTDTGFGMTRLNDTIDVCPIHRNQAVVVDGKIERE